jgi:hypothetical protein
MSRLTVGQRLSERLFAAEAAIDSALAETASLCAMLPRARAEACLSSVTGQQVFDEAAASVTALTEARAHMVATHKSLAALARKLGLETLAIGPLDKPEDAPPTGAGRFTFAENRVNKSFTNSPVTR